MVTLAVLGGVLFCFALCASGRGHRYHRAHGLRLSRLVAGWTGLVDFGSAAHGETGPEASQEVILVVAELALVLLMYFR